MIFYNPYLKLEENSSSEETSATRDYRKAWHNEVRRDAYENTLKQAEQLLERRLRLEDFEEKYFL